MGWIYMVNTRLWSFKFKGSLCWVQLNHTKDNQPSNTRKLGWAPYGQCQYMISLKGKGWYRTN